MSPWVAGEGGGALSYGGGGGDSGPQPRQAPLRAGRTAHQASLPLPEYQRRTLRNPDSTRAVSHPSPRRRRPQSRCRKGHAATCQEAASAGEGNRRTQTRPVSLTPGSPRLSPPGAEGPPGRSLPPPAHAARDAAGPQLLGSLQLTPRRRAPAATRPSAQARQRPEGLRLQGPAGAPPPACPGTRAHRSGPSLSPACRALRRRRTHPAVGRRPVPAASARRAAGDGRPVPDRAAASIHSCGGLRPAAAAALRADPAAAPAPAATASLAPVQLNDVVQGHVHFVGHGGRGISLSSSARVSTP